MGRAPHRRDRRAFVRRLQGAVRHVDRLIRGDIANPDRHRIEVQGHQVVDLHNLNDRAKRFVVGVAIRHAFEDKERAVSPTNCCFSFSTS